MSYDSATGALAILGGVAVLAALILFRHPRWLLQWLKGTLALVLLATGIYCLVIAVNLPQYDSLEGMEPGCPGINLASG